MLGSSTRCVRGAHRLIRITVTFWIASLLVFGSGPLGLATAESSPPAIAEFPLPSSGGFPFGITAGPDGNVWFTELSKGVVGKINVLSPNKIAEFPIGTSSQILAITAGPDRNVWFTEYTGNKVGRITPSGEITDYPVPTANSGPAGISSGPDGNVWFTESLADKIGRLTPGGSFTEFTFPAPAPSVACRAPHDIVSGPDGNLWFTESSSHTCQAGSPTNTCHGSVCVPAYQHIGRITPAGVITEFALSTPDPLPFGITRGPDNNLWFTEFTGNRIGRISPGAPNKITEFALPAGPPTGTSCLSHPVPTACASLKGITTGPDGNIWFVESRLNRLGFITVGGVITEVPLAAESQPQYIVTGPDHKLWWTEGGANGIGRLLPAQRASSGGAPVSGPAIGIGIGVVALIALLVVIFGRGRATAPKTGGSK